MSKVSISSAELRSQSQAYQQAVQSISEMRGRIENANSDMANHWQGGAYEGYISQYTEVVSPAIDKMCEGMEVCCQNLNSYANVIDERDAADRSAWSG